MAWEQALADPHMIRLADWLEEKVGEKDMARLKEEGWIRTKWDLEDRKEYHSMKIIMVKDPSGVERPFVQVWVGSMADHKACPMSHVKPAEVKLEEVKPETKEVKEIKIPGRQKEETETRQMTPKQRRGKEDQTSLETIFKWKWNHTNIKEEMENIDDDDKETSHKSIKKKKEKTILTYNCKEEITPAIIKLLTRTY
jgi:hypothetical protein